MAEEDMAEVLVTTIVLMTDNVRGCLERAKQADDIDEIKAILNEADSHIDQLVASAKTTQAKIDAQRT